MNARPFCHADPTCVRAYIHSGDHLPGCRTCGSTAHTTCTGDTMPQPRTDGPWLLAASPEFPFIPHACVTGTCTHDTCLRYRSPRCRSGECTHAAKGLICAEGRRKPTADQQ